MSSDPKDHNAQPTNAPQDVLDAEAARFLASLQQRLSQTQSAAAELKNRETAVAEQTRTLDARRAEVENAEREFQAKQNQLAAKAAGIEDRERAIAQNAAELKERRTELERAEAESVAERDRLIAEGKAAQQRMEAEAKAKTEVLAVGIERARAAADARRAEVEQSLKLLEARVEQTEQREQELEARESTQAREAAALATKMNKAEVAAAALAAREQKSEQTERALAEREKSAKALADKAERLTAEHENAAASIEKDRAAVSKLRAEVEKAERSARAAAEETKAAADLSTQRKAELDRRESSMLTREQQLRAAQDELERRRVFVSQCEAQSVQLEATSRHLREQAEQIKVSAERQVAQWQDKATEAQFQADSSQQQVQKLQEQLAVAQKRASSLEEEMDQVKVLGINLSPEAQGRIDGLTKRAESAEQRAATLQEIIDQHSDEVAKAESRYDTVARQLDEAQRILSSTGDAHSDQMVKWQKQAEKAAAEVAASLAQAQRAQADAERATTELNDHRQRATQAEERARALNDRVAAAEQAAQQADERVKQAAAQATDQAAESARAEARAALQTELKAAQARTAELEAQAKKRESELADLRARATVAEAASAGGNGGEGFTTEQRRRLEAELAQREEALGVLANRLLNSEERVVAMQAQLDRVSDELHAREEMAAKGEIPVAHNDASGVVHDATPEVAASDSRRRRLRRVRELLGQEHRKVLLAKEALGRHKAEADAVLQQRARLSQLAQNIQAAEAEANKTRAKSSAGSVVIAAMMTLITVSGLSYLAAGVLSPSTYAARATLAADSDGRSPTDQQKSTWMSAHERLATDLQVYTVAAEKFQQRGMRDLSNPAAVQERFGSALALITDVPGQITFELRGVGRENTARELETFVGAVSAIANSRRETRSDGLGTSVSKQAEAGSDALDGKRQSAMLIALGAGLAASWGAGFGVYRLMTRSRKPASGSEALEAFDAPGTAGRVGPQRPGNVAA